ncbi:MAG: 50S ribosomal protein L21 [Cyanobacteria bacterium J06626_4]
MTYAIIEAGGTQLRVEAGRFYDLNRLHVEEDGNVTIDKVLFVSHDGESLVGQPLVEGATVSGTVMRHLRGRKIIVYKMKPKKKTRKKRGHRQELTRLMVDSISLKGKVLAGNAGEVTEPPADDAVNESATVEVVATSPAATEEE